jgi:hypothetical protein
LLAGTGVTGTGIANTQTWVLDLGANAQEIAAGSTANYIVEIVNYVPSLQGTNFLSRQFQLDDVHFQDIFNNGEVLVTGLNSYVNAGSFPLSAPNFNPSN